MQIEENCIWAMTTYDVLTCIFGEGIKESLDGVLHIK